MSAAGCGWTRIVDASGGGGGASNGFGHFSPPIPPGPAESRLSIFNAIMSRQV